MPSGEFRAPLERKNIPCEEDKFMQLKFVFHVIVAVVAVTSLENNLSSYYKPSRNTHHNTAPPDDPVNSRINVVALTPDYIFVTPN